VPQGSLSLVRLRLRIFLQRRARDRTVHPAATFSGRSHSMKQKTAEPSQLRVNMRWLGLGG
jgi:hypothetical protein